MDDIQDVSARIVGEKVTFSAGWGVVRPLRPPLATGLSVSVCVCVVDTRTLCQGNHSLISSQNQ